MGQAANNYFASASYYYETGKDIKQALEWINKAVELNPKAYWVIRTKSLIQAKMGDYKMALETAELSKKLASEGKNQQYVKMNEDSIAEWKKSVK